MPARSTFALALTGLVAATGLFATPGHAAIVQSGNTLSAGDGPFAAVRFRELGAINTNGNSQELYVGEPNLGVSANRTGQNLQWSPGDNAFVLDYVDATDTLTATITNGTSGSAYVASYVYSFDNPGYNTILLQLVNRTAGSNVTLTDLTVDGDLVGDFEPASNSGFVDWTLTGLDLSGDFTVTGNLHLAGPFTGSDELNRAEIGFAVPEPATASLALAAGLGLLARRRKA